MVKGAFITNKELSKIKLNIDGIEKYIEDLHQYKDTTKEQRVQIKNIYDKICEIEETLELNLL